MRAGMCQPTIKLTWKYKLYDHRKNNRREISERVSAGSDILEGSDFEDIVNLDYISRIIREKNGIDNTWNSNISDYLDYIYSPIVRNGTQEQQCYAISQAIGWISFQIRRRSIEYLRRNDIVPTNIVEYQKSIERKCKLISNLYCFYLSNRNPRNMLALSITPEQFKKELADVLGDNPVNEFERYIKEINKQHGNNKRICCLFSEKMRRPLIALSGYWDCEYQLHQILKGDKGPYQERKIRKFQEICDTIPAVFIRTNTNECYFYHVTWKKIGIAEKLKSAVDDVITGKQSADDVCEKYSCCERKVLTQLHTNIGKSEYNLYVTKAPCPICADALEYFRQEHWKINTSFPKL